MKQNHATKPLWPTFAALLTLAVSAAFARENPETIDWAECARLSKQNHPDLVSAREKVNQSKSTLGTARSAYLPKISGNASISASGTSKVASDSSSTNYSTNTDRLVSQYLAEKQTAGKTEKKYTYGMSGKQLIFDGTKTVYQILAAEKSVGEAESQYRISSMAVRKNLRVAFIQLLRTQESMEILGSIVDRRKKNLKLVSMRYTSGREHLGAYLNAEASLAQAEYEMRQSVRSLDSNRRQLLKEMGIGTLRPIAVRGDIAPVRVERRKPDLDELADSHPSVVMAVRKRESADMNMKAKIADFSPSISATGSVNRTDSNFPPGITNWYAGIELTAPIFLGGEKYYQLKNAQAIWRQYGADVKSTRDKTILALEQKWTAWQNALDYVDVQGKFLRAAEERSRIAEGQYSIGLILFDNWIIIEDDLARMKKSYLDAQAAALTAEAEWLEAKGVSIENER